MNQLSWKNENRQMKGSLYSYNENTDLTIP